jgi:TM2 domain-containing membrane protein YozV
MPEENAVMIPATMNDSFSQPTHNKVIGYLCWLFGFTGLHRFYYGKPATGILWLLTGGLLLIGWIVDLFLVPSMDAEAQKMFTRGYLDYSVAWLLLIFLGIFGIHRFYMGKWGTGILYLLTGGLLFIGVIYDFCTMNRQISELNGARPLLN